MKTNNIWQRVANFFEHGDLVPFAVMISVYHFAVALSQHDGWFIALAMGVFVDMLHFRTVRHAVRSRSRQHVVIAGLTTAMSYGFHILFYQSGDDTGFKLLHLLLATPLPFGIPILAWQQEQSAEPSIVAYWKNRRELLIRAICRLRSKINQLESVVNKLELLSERQGKEVKRLESLLKQSESKANEWQLVLNGMKPVTRDVLLMMAGHELTGKQIAKKHNVSEAHVSSVKSKLNGAK